MDVDRQSLNNFAIYAISGVYPKKTKFKNQFFFCPIK